MKTKPILPLTLAAILSTGYSQTIEKPAPSKAALAEAAFAARMVDRGMEGVLTKLSAAQAEAGTGVSREAVLASLILAKEVPLTVADDVKWADVSAESRKDVLRQLAAAPIDSTTAKILVKIPYTPCPEIAAKSAEILALLDKSDFNRYRIKYTTLRPAVNAVAELLEAQEIIDLTGRVLGYSQYLDWRKNMLKRCMEVVMKTRASTNPPTSLEDDMIPVIAALNAPLWEGLTTVMAPYGLDLKAPDYTGLITIANEGCAAYDAKTRNDLGQCIGAVMFVKGVAGYNTWKNQPR